MMQETIQSRPLPMQPGVCESIRMHFPRHHLLGPHGLKPSGYEHLTTELAQPPAAVSYANYTVNTVAFSFLVTHRQRAGGQMQFQCATTCRYGSIVTVLIPYRGSALGLCVVSEHRFL